MHKMLHIPPAWIGSDEPPPAEPAKELPEIPIPAAVLADAAPPPKPTATIGCCCRTTPLGHLVISGITIVVIGLILRVLYSLTQCHPAAGFFGAVNQSTWESLKLLLWPILFWWLFVAMGTTQLARNLNGAVVSAYSAAACMLCLVALVTEVGHTYAQWIDILLVIPSVFIGQACGIFLGSIAPYNTRVSLVMLTLLLVFLSIFTLAAVPPSPFLFADRSNSSNYGVPAACNTFSFDQIARIQTLLLANSSSTVI